MNFCAPTTRTIQTRAEYHLSYDDYLELYSRFKIKVQSAIDAGMDTSSTQSAELESFRYQLADNFMKDDAYNHESR